MSARHLGFAVLLALLFAWPQPAGAGPSDALILVARPQLRQGLYARTVLMVAPFGNNQHYGFIINRPTAFRLGDVLPGHAPSQQVVDPVFLGGPVYTRLIFALVQDEQKPGRGCVRMTPGLYAVFDGRAVHQVIAASPQRARFFTGFVVWRPGELAREITGRLWYALGPDAALVTGNPRGMWERLVARAQRAGELRLTSAGTEPDR
jgi:putative transcriptional regulator